MLAISALSDSGSPPEFGAIMVANFARGRTAWKIPTAAVTQATHISQAKMAT